MGSKPTPRALSLISTLAMSANATPRHVVFLSTEGAGHILPTVPLVTAMTEQGIQVTYYMSDTSQGMVDSVSGSGATLRQYRKEQVMTEDRMVAAFCPPMAPLLEDLRTLEQPADILVYDPFFPVGAIMGKILGLPAVALIVNTGPGCTAAMDTPAMEAAFQGVSTWVQDKFDVNLSDLGIPMASWYSKSLNVVLTCEEFFEGPKNDKQQKMFAGARFECVGSLVDPKMAQRPCVADFPLDGITAARDGGKKVVLLSLGTAVTGQMWERPCPLTQDNDDGTLVGEQTLSQMKGRDIANFVWQAAFKGLGGDEELLVIMATGEQDGVLESLELPSNFLAFKTIPQLQVLPLCSAFVTHGGMGSTMESLVYGVPLVTIPVFGDQVTNADNAAKANLGVSFRYPLKTLTPDTLRDAVRSVTMGAGYEESLYKTSVAQFATKMKACGGASKAIDFIMSSI